MKSLAAVNQHIGAFARRYPTIGPAMWIAAAQYFVIQFIVGYAWQPPYAYSISDHTISDLGARVCGTYGDRLVCSPLNLLMNLSFIILGITMVAGSLLIAQTDKKPQATNKGFVFMALGGLGTVLVGLFPEDSVSLLHIIGAGLPFFIGNMGILLLAVELDFSRKFRYLSFICGTTSLFALAFLVSRNYGLLGVGGVERIVAYPQTAWLMLTGVYLLLGHRNSSPRAKLDTSS